METILVTGGAGFLGFHTTLEHLARFQGSIRILDESPFGFSPYSNVNFPASRFQYRHCDMTRKADFIKAAEGTDVIVHLARSEDLSRTADLADYNCSMAESIAAYAMTHDLKSMILASSFQVYGNNADESIPEDSPCDPITPYALSKYLCEGIFQETAARTGISTDILRYFNIYGPNAATGIMTFIKEQCARSRDAVDISLHNDGHDGRDYIYIDDAVSAILRSIYGNSRNEDVASCSDETDTLCRIINVGTGRCTRVFELIELIQKIAGRRIHINYGSARDPIRTVSADCGNMYARLGMGPVISLEDGLARFWQVP